MDTEEEQLQRYLDNDPQKPVNPVSAYLTPTLPDYLWKLVAFEEFLCSNQLIPFEESRRKKDELEAKQGFQFGVSYFDHRIIRIREVLKDKGLIKEADLQTEVERQKGHYEKKGKKVVNPLELEVLAMINLTLGDSMVMSRAFERHYEQMKGRTPITGARVVAKAWVDPDFKALLKISPKEAILGWDPSVIYAKDKEIIDPNGLEILENTEKIHNVCVCTLCSCYPREYLGEPPLWYISKEYKQRIINEPRKYLADYGLNLNDDVEIRVYDITADIHYMVLPMRPKGTEKLSEEELSMLVTRDSLLGAGLPLPPDRLPDLKKAIMEKGNLLSYP
jgi:nitrile hydratase alpha subunit